MNKSKKSRAQQTKESLANTHLIQRKQQQIYIHSLHFIFVYCGMNVIVAIILPGAISSAYCELGIIHRAVP